MARFRTQIVLNGQLDLDWLSVVERSARCICVRIPGLYTQRQWLVQDSWHVGWENAMFSMLNQFKAGEPAFACVLPPRLNKWWRIQGCVSAVKWAIWERPAAAHYNRFFTQIRRVCKLPIAVCADDFGARWMVGSGHQFDWTVMDNPMLSKHEAQEYMAGRSAIVRRSSELVFGSVERLDMHFDAAGALLSMFSPCPLARHAHWGPPDRAWVMTQARGGSHFHTWPLHPEIETKPTPPPPMLIIRR